MCVCEPTLHRLLEEHGRLRTAVATAPVDAIDREGRSLLQRMRLGPTHSSDAPGEAPSSNHGYGSWLSGGADFQSVAPKVAALLERLQSARTHLQQSWAEHKQHLDQALQLHLYEQDAAKVCVRVCVCDTGRERESDRLGQREREREGERREGGTKRVLEEDRDGRAKGGPRAREE